MTVTITPTLAAERPVEEASMLPRPFVVHAVRRELATTVTLDLVPLDGQVMAFRPGQFTMLAVPGVGEVPISVSTDPAHPEVLGHTIRAAGAVTTMLCGMAPGAVVGLRGPYGTDWCCETAEGSDLVFIGGGIGMAPLRPAIYHVLRNRDRYGRVAILSGSRSPDDVLFAAQLGEWRSHFDLDVRVAVDRPHHAWRGHVGVVTSLIPTLGYDWPRVVAFVCGPDVMMENAAIGLTRFGVLPSRIRLTMERNMKCGIGLCGHCQVGPLFVCRQGPVVTYADIARFYSVKEV